MLYRHLTENEKAQLMQRGCHADNWQLITVKDGFEPSQLFQVTFSGQVQLGSFKTGTGIRNVQLQNCTIEDNVTICQCGLINNYIVRSHASIKYCGTISTTDRATFGNGAKVAVVNEGGGREVLLYNGLTAQIAYLMAFMRHRPVFITTLEQLIKSEIQSTLPEKGVIGHHASIESVTTLCDVLVGDSAKIVGALHLKNGTILSSAAAPAYVGHGVLAYDFIASYGSKVDNASILKSCFVGEGCAIDRQFSAENSLFFANSQMYHGEACSVFAAPYSVSHHKSTLLIATYCGFLNVGSGSNQSNHMYKLGPVHQGVMERGCKLGSDSYVLWPAKIGAFTFVSGRHYSNPDISAFPFSYLLDDEGTSQLVPAANLRSVGTLRDSAKWPQRDIRKGPKSDLIRFDLFNPFTIGAVLNGRNALIELDGKQKAETGFYTVGDVKIKKPALKRGIDIYNEAICLYVGNRLAEKISEQKDLEQIKNIGPSSLSLEWADLAGAIINQHQLEELIESIECKDITSMSRINKQLVQLHEQYLLDEWDWMVANSESLIGLDLAKAPKDQLIAFIAQWEKHSERFYQMLAKDAQKEFSERSKTGYGYKDTVRNGDFDNVRGSIDNNSFMADIQKRLNDSLQKSKDAIHQLETR